MKKYLFGAASILSITIAQLFMGSLAYAATNTCTWTAAGSDDKFSNTANWSGCGATGMPVNGDMLAFPMEVDSDTTFGNSRKPTNDLTSLSLSGITFTGSRIQGDYDDYTIGGSSITMTGNITNTSYYDMVGGNPIAAVFDTDLTFLAPQSVMNSIYFNATLSFGSNSMRLNNSSGSGNIFGTGNLTQYATPSTGKGGSGGGIIKGPGFNGSLTLEGAASVAITSSPDDLARHAASIVVNGGALYFVADEDTDMTFATPIVLNDGYVGAYQDMHYVTEPLAINIKTIDLTGPVTINKKLEATLDNVNLKLSGTTVGGELLSLSSGLSTKLNLTIGSIVKKSELKTTILTAADNANGYVYVTENQVVVIAEGTSLVSTNSTVDGGILKGKGTIKSLAMKSGVIAPGASPGCLTSGNLTYTGGSVEIELNGATVCTEYDQQVVNGTVDLGTATVLNVTRLAAYAPAVGASYTILNNDAADAITGTFAGKAEGSTFVLDGYTYKISYIGGDGNDVVLTVTGVPAVVAPALALKAPNTGFKALSTPVAYPVIALIALTAAGALMTKVARRNK
jgi:fibronectin-binding autotransporter adhesin